MQVQQERVCLLFCCGFLQFHIQRLQFLVGTDTAFRKAPFHISRIQPLHSMIVGSSVMAWQAHPLPAPQSNVMLGMVHSQCLLLVVVCCCVILRGFLAQCSR